MPANPAPLPLTEAELDAMEALLEASGRRSYTFRKRISEDGRKDLWAIEGAMFASDAETMCAAANALPRLLAAAREAIRLRAHYAAAGPEHNLLALLDLYHERAEKVRADAKDTEAERDALAAEVATLRAKIAQHNVWHSENQADAARLAAEVGRVKGRLERATNFSWRGGAVWAVMPEDSTLWHVYEERGSCGAALVGKYPTLDAAWSAAEAHAAAQGTDREGAPS